MSYDFYTSSPETASVTWGERPTTDGIELWHGPAEWGQPYKPITPGIPVIRRKPKRDRWEKYVETIEKIREITDITEVTKAIEVRPVLICGWCGARIPRGMEDEPCEYCGS